MKVVTAIAALGLLCFGTNALNSSPKSDMLRVSKKGCYELTLQDAVSAPAESDIHMTAGMTAFLCLAHCAVSGFPYSGVVNAKNCECSDEISESDYLDTDSGNCLPCVGEAEGQCGNTDIISIYSTGLIGALSRGDAGTLYQGCFPRTADLGENLASDELDIDQLYGEDLTAEACVSYCRFSNKQYSFITEGNRCFCSTTASPASSVDDSNCDTECEGQPGSRCGGVNYVAQYLAPDVEFGVEVTGEGATHAGTLEADNHRVSYFKINGVYHDFTSVSDREMGINIITLNRADPTDITGTENFDADRRPGDKNRLVNFLKDVDDDTVLLLSVRGDASATCGDACMAQLRRMGSFNTPGEYESWALVAYKGHVCAESISWLKEKSYPHDPIRASEAMMATIKTQVPLVCFEPEHLQDRDVKVVSEGGVDPANFEYTPLNPQTNTLERGLFYVNGQRIISSTWETGINVVAFPRASPSFRPNIRDFPESDDDAGSDFADFIDDLDDDTVVLVSVWGDANRICNTECRDALTEIGASIEFGQEDSYALVGYKGSGCSAAITERPAFVTEAYSARPGADSNLEKEASPVEVEATIPRECPEE